MFATRTTRPGALRHPSEASEEQSVRPAPKFQPGQPRDPLGAARLVRMTRSLFCSPIGGRRANQAHVLTSPSLPCFDLDEHLYTAVCLRVYSPLRDAREDPKPVAAYCTDQKCSFTARYVSTADELHVVRKLAGQLYSIEKAKSGDRSSHRQL